MLISREDSPRTRCCQARLTLIVMIIGTFFVSGSIRLLAQCPPSNLQDSFDDVLVDDASLNPTLGMAADGAIIVSYEGVLSAGSYPFAEILARRFSSSGSAQANPFPIAVHNEDEDLECVAPQEFRDPSLSISASGTVNIGFTYQMPCQYVTGSCTPEEPCPQDGKGVRKNSLANRPSCTLFSTAQCSLK